MSGSRRSSLFHVKASEDASSSLDTDELLGDLKKKVIIKLKIGIWFTLVGGVITPPFSSFLIISLLRPFVLKKILYVTILLFIVGCSWRQANSYHIWSRRNFCNLAIFSHYRHHQQSSTGNFFTLLHGLSILILVSVTLCLTIMFIFAEIAGKKYTNISDILILFSFLCSINILTTGCTRLLVLVYPSFTYFRISIKPNLINLNQ